MDEIRPAWESRALDQSLRPAESSRRSRFLESTRRIVDAGIDLVAESEKGTFTVQAVAARAGISLHSFYRFFPSKDDLSLAIFEEVNRVGTDHIAKAAATGSTPLERLRLTIISPLQDTFHHPREVPPTFIVGEDLRLKQSRPREISAAFIPYRRLLAHAISESQDAGDFQSIDPVADAEMIQDLQMSMYHLKAQGIPHAQSLPLDEALWDFSFGALRRRSQGAMAKRKK